MKKKGFRNITPRIISILFAIIMWTYVMGEINPKIDKEFKDIKVDILNLETLEKSGLVLMEPMEVTVDVKLSGRRNDLLNVTSKDIVAKVDLIGYSEGSYKIPVEINNPDKTELLDFNPKQILFKFDAITQKQLPIVVKTVGKPANGYSIGKSVANPSSVFIKGPRSWVNSVETIVAMVDLNGSSNDIKTSVPIKAIDDAGKEVTTIELNPNIVDVTVPVLKIKEVTIEPQIKGRPLNGFKLTNFIVSPRTVKIRGYEEVLNNIDSIKTEPIDISYSINDVTRQVSLIVPEGVEIVSSEEIPAIRIEVEEIIRKDFQYHFDDIKLLKLNQELEIDKSRVEDKITVTVEGVKSIIEQLSSKDITVYMNLDKLGEGEHEVYLTTESPLGTEVVDISPNRVNITLVNKTDADEEEGNNDDNGVTPVE
jgi:YbbR domain-containing protein